MAHGIHHDPDILWLQRRWNLPAGALPAVESLLQAQSEGSTAIRLKTLPESWGEAVGAAGQNLERPLVLRQRGEAFWLQSRKAFLAEEEIRSRLKTLHQSVSAPDPVLLTRARQYFPSSGAERNLPLEAAETLLSRRLTLLTGGPGTGKTYTLARLLALFAGTAGEKPRIAVSAPTGKAAGRLKETLLAALPALAMEDPEARKILETIAEQCQTLHRLLRYNPARGRSPYGPANPLPYDVVVVDEASMIDLSLWFLLLRALPPEVRLILVGDPFQLESVGQGNIFSAIVDHAGKGGALAGSHVHLEKSWRFRDQPDIAALAGHLERGEVEKVENLLPKVASSGASGGLGWVESAEPLEDSRNLPASIRQRLEAIAFAVNPEQALAAVEKVCLLFPHRRFKDGALAFSDRLQTEFSRADGFTSYPIIINRNDYAQNLRNGQVGIVYLGEGKMKAWFREGEELRSVNLSALPDFSLAWGLTVHRAQGSEYDGVLVVLPNEESPLATRSLVYTAITRARREVWLYGVSSALLKATQTTSQRQSLL